MNEIEKTLGKIDDPDYEDLDTDLEKLKTELVKMGVKRIKKFEIGLSKIIVPKGIIRHLQDTIQIRGNIE